MKTQTLFKLIDAIIDIISFSFVLSIMIAIAIVVIDYLTRQKL